MAVLQEKQYEVNGVVFGRGCPVEVENWTPGAPELVTDDRQIGGADGVRMGADYRGSSVHQFDLYTNMEDEVGAWGAVAELAHAWGADEIRSEPAAVTSLRYRVAGQTRRVYGRPRRFTPAPTNLSMAGRIHIPADFTTVDHRIYDDAYKYATVQIGQPKDPEAGLVVPFIPPFTTTPPGLPRQGKFTVGGEVPTPAIVIFQGPLQPGAKAEVAGWTVEIKDQVYAGLENRVTVDANVWARSATTPDGGAVRVNPRVTRISKMMLPPGEHEIIFSGTDLTGVASVTVGWYDAYPSPR